MSRDADCVFCRIASGELPTPILFQNETAVAFLDIAPLCEGHLLLIPREHYAAIGTMSSEACSQLCSLLPLLGRALRDVCGVSDYHILQNNGPLAGQVVQHVHFHLIPRKPDDGLGFRWKAGRYQAGRDRDVVEAYRRALASAAP